MTKTGRQIAEYWAVCEETGVIPTIAGLALALGYRDIPAMLAADGARRREIDRALLRLQGEAQIALLRTPAGAKYYLDLYFAGGGSGSDDEIIVRLVDGDDYEG